MLIASLSMLPILDLRVNSSLQLMVRYRSDVRGKSLAEGFAALRPQPLAELKIEAEGETNEVARC